MQARLSLAAGMVAMLLATASLGRPGAADPPSQPAFFNGQLVSIHATLLSPTASANIIAHNKNLNLIYVSAGFTPVINDIQEKPLHFNPLWQVVAITFNAGVTPQQFTSEAQILSARSNGQVTLTFTNEVATVPV